VKDHTKTVLVRYGIPLGILLCAVVVVLLPVKSEIRWHLRYGFHVVTNGTRIRIPFFYKADKGTEHHLLVYMSPKRTFFGTEEPEYGLVRVTFADPGSSEASPERWNERAALADRDRLVAADVTEGSATFAGRNGMCFEYKLASSDLEYASFWGSGIGVSCWFGSDVLVRFQGASRSLTDFHEMIQSAEDVRGKR